MNIFLEEEFMMKYFAWKLQKNLTHTIYNTQFLKLLKFKNKIESFMIKKKMTFSYMKIMSLLR